MQRSIIVHRSIYRLNVFTGIMILLAITACHAQPLNNKKQFSQQDTLRGSITPERAWWDVTSYNIHVEPDFKSKSITGKNILSFVVLDTGSTMQIDLQEPMELEKAVYQGKALSMRRKGNVYYLQFPASFSKGQTAKVELVFWGKPREAKNPPWDGGWIWKKDRNGFPWMSVACQGLGASVWYPCKDHQSDEPDSASLSIVVQDSLTGVGNGRLRSKVRNNNGTTTYQWAVVNPVNSYNIVPYIGRYANWTEDYAGEAGKLDCSYWVLDYNLERAKKHFEQVPGMLKSFEYWFGPYPFYEDSYKLVESPHLGMEHQSAIAYGNRYMNGYLGKDLSGTGWGEKWDFIIIHESGHEWFANSISTNDIADMWVHEGFTSYSETLYTDYHFGKEAGNAYMIGIRKNIENDIPVIGHYGVNQEGSGDMYPKGASVVHTIRQVIGDDAKFREIMRGLNKTYRHKTVNSSDVENYISREAGIDFSKVFDQYLRTVKVPVLEYQVTDKQVRFRWTNTVEGFDMPVKVTLDSEQWIRPTSEWSVIDRKAGSLMKVDPNFYITVRKIN